MSRLVESSLGLQVLLEDSRPCKVSQHKFDIKKGQDEVLVRMMYPATATMRLRRSGSVQPQT